MLAWGQGGREAQPCPPQLRTPGSATGLRPRSRSMGAGASPRQLPLLTQACPYLVGGQPLALTERLQKLRDPPDGEEWAGVGLGTGAKAAV